MTGWDLAEFCVWVEENSLHIVENPKHITVIAHSPTSYGQVVHWRGFNDPGAYRATIS